MKDLPELASLHALIDVLPNPTFVINRDHRIVLINDGACALFGHAREDLLTRGDGELFAAEEVRIGRAADDLVFESGEDDEGEDQLTDPAGNVTHLITRKRRISIAGADYVVAIVTDVTAYREAEARNRYLAFHDALTELPNRTLLNDRIEQALLRMPLTQQPCVLLYIDLDRFKDVNDRYGHQVGDELLRAFAARLSCLVRPSDTIARLGGDEFAIVLSDSRNDRDGSRLCHNVLAAAVQPFAIAGLQVMIGASIGLVIAPMQGVGQVELQRRADIALYHAKNSGRGCCRTYGEAMDECLKERHWLEAEMRKALAAGTGFQLYYQPIAGIVSGRIEGFEALARWQHPTRGLIMPDQFIPVAEASGLIVELGEWILARACLDAAAWDPPLRLSVNISPVQFVTGDLAGTVARLLAASDLPASRLELEITEGVLIQDAARALALLGKLRELGAQIVLDDFGTGYSSLSYFREFPFDKVKIDRTFVSDMLHNAHARAIVEAVISLGRALELQVVAEGVETDEQLTLLRQQRCSQVQGYLISPPMPIAHFIGSVLGKPRRSTDPSVQVA